MLSWKEGAVVLVTALRWASPGAGMWHRAAAPSSEGTPGLLSSGLCTRRLLAPPALGAACWRLELCTGQSGESCRDSYCAEAMEG